MVVPIYVAKTPFSLDTPQGIRHFGRFMTFDADSGCIKSAKQNSPIILCNTLW